MCIEIQPSLDILVADLHVLDRFGIQVRYPGMMADREDAREVLKSIEAFRSAIRAFFRF